MRFHVYFDSQNHSNESVLRKDAFEIAGLCGIAKTEESPLWNLGPKPTAWKRGAINAGKPA
jgi:hypothetical protein